MATHIFILPMKFDREGKNRNFVFSSEMRLSFSLPVNISQIDLTYKKEFLNINLKCLF